MATRSTEPSANPARGAILVVVAIAVGLFLLRNGIDTDVTRTDDRASQTTGATDDGATDDGATDDGATDDGATDDGATDDGATDDGATDDGSTDPPDDGVRPPSEVSVIVLNGSGLAGAAGRWSDGIAAYGYQMLPPDNANGRVEITQVQHQAGFEAEAAALVESLGSPPGVSPQPLGGEPPGPIANAQIVVVVGPDVAQGDPPPPTG
jgi:hypothetical protein